MTPDRQIRFDAAHTALPLIAILRGITPKEAVAVGRMLYSTGFRLIEIPLNSPDPFDSIALMRNDLPVDALVGAGTVRQMDEVDRLAVLKADLVVMPHAALPLITQARRHNLICLPGVATLTEAFSALDADASGLKLFPAEQITPPVIKAMRTVLPKTVRLYPVGGITLDKQASFLAAGANGFGVGGALYTPGMTIEQLGERAARFAMSWRQGHG